MPWLDPYRHLAEDADDAYRSDSDRDDDDAGPEIDQDEYRLPASTVAIALEEEARLKHSFLDQLRNINRTAMQCVEENNLQQALKMFRLCESIIRKTALLAHGIRRNEEKSLRLTVYNNIACAYQKKNELETALEYLLKVIEECRMPTPRDELDAQEEAGRDGAFEGEDEEDGMLADQPLFPAETAVFDEATAHLNACVVLSGLGRHNQALRYVRRAVTLFVQVRDPAFIARATRSLARNNSSNRSGGARQRDGSDEVEISHDRALRRGRWESSELPGKFYKGLALAHYNEAVQHEHLGSLEKCEESVAAAQEVGE